MNQNRSRVSEKILFLFLLVSYPVFAGMFGIGMPELFIVLIVFYCLPLYFYLRTLEMALSQCSPDSRTLSPKKVWILFIPVFNLIWHFIVVKNLAASLHKEFVKREIDAEPNPGQSVGNAMCILIVIGFIPFDYSGLAKIVGFVCWIVYWVKISDYSKRLKYENPNNCKEGQSLDK